MISVLNDDDRCFVSNNGDRIYIGTVIHSTGNKEAIFRIDEINKTHCTYSYKFAHQEQWNIGNTDYPLVEAKKVFVLNDPNNLYKSNT